MLALQLRGSTRRRALGRGIGEWGRLVFETHVRGHLAEEARRFDGRLREYEYSTATEDMLIQREGGGPEHAQEVGEVQCRRGVHLLFRN